MLMNVSTVFMTVTQMQTASTLSADITVLVRKDLLEMVAHVQVKLKIKRDLPVS